MNSIDKRTEFMDGASGMDKSNSGLGAVDRHSFDIVS
jgi:hypothetical protein